MQKTEQRIAGILVSVLLVLCLGLFLFLHARPKEEPVVENRKESLYLEERIPPQPAAGEVNINTASRKQLMTLPGIGPALADRIIQYREEFGPFPHPACLMEVMGIGEAVYGNIADKIYAK